MGARCLKLRYLPMGLFVSQLLYQARIQFVEFRVDGWREVILEVTRHATPKMAVLILNSRRPSTGQPFESIARHDGSINLFSAVQRSEYACGRR